MLFSYWLCSVWHSKTFVTIMFLAPCNVVAGYRLSAVVSLTNDSVREAVNSKQASLVICSASQRKCTAANGKRVLKYVTACIRSAECNTVKHHLVTLSNVTEPDSGTLLPIDKCFPSQAVLLRFYICAYTYTWYCQTHTPTHRF
ncbi:hypothetical protein KIL84_018978 [Mauremys mutica]|uniref:Uncharacterized protein n=1 Tax=Mauremys mutica TaxID=74926 RepID=A0A9D3XSZ1_9SAUR|nr:hypothetical protein KIL84_018978 [Mauremys mutica]